MTHDELLKHVQTMADFLKREHALLERRDMDAVLKMLDEKIHTLKAYRHAQVWIGENGTTIRARPPGARQEILSILEQITEQARDNEDRLKRYAQATERVMGRLLKNAGTRHPQIDGYNAKGRLIRPNLTGFFNQPQSVFHLSSQL